MTVSYPSPRGIYRKDDDDDGWENTSHTGSTNIVIGFHETSWWIILTLLCKRHPRPPPCAATPCFFFFFIYFHNQCQSKNGWESLWNSANDGSEAARRISIAGTVENIPPIWLVISVELYWFLFFSHLKCLFVCLRTLTGCF